MDQERKTVVVLGASPNPERYSYKAVSMLLSAGWKVLPVHPACEKIQGQVCRKSLSEIHEPVHTITVYVNADRLSAMAQPILSVKPKRVVFNPGTENQMVMDLCREQGVEVIAGCTLVMLSSGTF